MMLMRREPGTRKWLLTLACLVALAGCGGAEAVAVAPTEELGVVHAAVAPANTNLAYKKPTQQSSTYTISPVGGSSDRAVDGNTNGDYSAGSVTHTNFQYDPWWQVDLQVVRRIDQLEIWNRTDCCGERLSNYYVFVSEQPFASGNLQATLSQPGVIVYHRTASAAASTTVDVNGQLGRYVRVQLGGYNPLSLAEVRVIGEPNLAMGKPVMQSSTYPVAYGGSADRAVDGNTNGDYFALSVSATNFQAGPWWEVDLQGVNGIKRIELWNRTDCCAERLSSYYVFVSQVPFVSLEINSTINQPGVLSFNGVAPAGSPSTISLDGQLGRYVRVQLAGYNVLSLAEVQVF
ncbi:discoidin domain-containing protein [Corallococcus exiguus]|uniref:galactose-binding domain-containing protein n=1 Tax=Corallococcus exiguus TaxID=83462 RepID=UPI001A8D28B9|nr:discoidin domain-containing protein [Corallococcus exiguus]MBN8466981.1 discoidin domain-containing protein [Corallococcus exiguus]